MTSVLVTGGAGFIGSHLCDRLLAEGKDVIAIDDLSSGRLVNLAEARSYGTGFIFYSLDVRTKGLASIIERHRPDVVYHLAARRLRRGPELTELEADVGVLGLLAVLESSMAAGSGKIVVASSADVYGRQRVLPARETALWSARPQTAAAVSKRVAEDYLRFYRRERGLEFTSVILPNVYGPRQVPEAGSGVVSSFACKMLAGDSPVVFGDGEETRDFLFVDDAVHLLALAAAGGSGLTVNGGTGLETSVVGLFRILAELTGFRGEPLWGPPLVGSIPRSALDPSLAGRELGWKPWTHLEDGLAETVAFLRDYQT
jgi:UDP-glucose 4-epimerase